MKIFLYSTDTISKVLGYVSKLTDPKYTIEIYFDICKELSEDRTERIRVEVCDQLAINSEVFEESYDVIWKELKDKFNPGMWDKLVGSLVMKSSELNTEVYIIHVEFDMATSKVNFLKTISDSIGSIAETVMQVVSLADIPNSNKFYEAGQTVLTCKGNIPVPSMQLLRNKVIGIVPTKASTAIVGTVKHINRVSFSELEIIKNMIDTYLVRGTRIGFCIFSGEKAVVFPIVQKDKNLMLVSDVENIDTVIKAVVNSRNDSITSRAYLSFVSYSDYDIRLSGLSTTVEFKGNSSIDIIVNEIIGEMRRIIDFSNYLLNYDFDTKQYRVNKVDVSDEDIHTVEMKTGFKSACIVFQAEINGVEISEQYLVPLITMDTRDGYREAIGRFIVFANRLPISEDYFMSNQGYIVDCFLVGNYADRLRLFSYSVSNLEESIFIKRAIKSGEMLTSLVSICQKASGLPAFKYSTSDSMKESLKSTIAEESMDDTTDKFEM